MGLFLAHLAIFLVFFTCRALQYQYLVPSRYFLKYHIKVLTFLLILDIEIPKILKKLTRLLLNLIIRTPCLTEIISCQGLGSLLLTQDILLRGYVRHTL